ncbi:MAG TPA: hypothetical protein PK539_00325 [Candidatus Paceibacterota bacterium]|nr:hypothetical protein [Candidatus Paceibacterota bacterium]
MYLGTAQYLPNLVIAIIIFIIGWLIAVVVDRIVVQIFNALRIDQALRAAGTERIVERAGFTLSSGKFVGALVKWFIIVIFLVASLNVLHLDQVNNFLDTVVLGYLPRVIAAVLILLAAGILAETMHRVVTGSAKAARLTSANFLGTVAKWSIWVFAVLAALYQLEIASQIVQTLFLGIVIAISLALGLAFGLGGQQAAARYIEHVREQIKN